MSQRLTILTEIDTHALAQADALYELGTLWNSPLTIISHCRLYGGDEKQTESRRTSQSSADSAQLNRNHDYTSTEWNEMNPVCTHHI